MYNKIQNVYGTNLFISLFVVIVVVYVIMICVKSNVSDEEHLEIKKNVEKKRRILKLTIPLNGR